MARAFISYSHRDEAFRQELETHLAPLRRQGLLSVWHDRRLTPGDALDDTISAHLEAAELILMLVSADFVASEYCYAREMERALERHRAGEARAISIVCRPCHFEGLPFARFVLLPTDAKAVTLWQDRDAAWVDVVRGIRRALQAPPSTPASSPTVDEPQAPTRKRSEGAVLPRPFTDLDRHDFLEAAFERMWAVFEERAAELEAANPGVVVRRLRIDAQSFAVRIFVNGKEVAAGSVYHGGGHFGRDQICFSSDASAPRNSMNEWFGVSIVQGAPMLTPGGMLRIGSGEKAEPVDADGAAESLWNSLLQQVKARTR